MPPKRRSMRPTRFWILALFCSAAALIAAAVADPLVEALSNAGIFGAGAYTDRSMADVAPVLAIGASCALTWIVLYVRKMLGCLDAAPDWLSQTARVLDGRIVSRLLPVVLAAQIAILFAMETLEQLATYGHMLGPAVWLGGPAAISLSIHAAVGIAASFALVRVLHTCAASVVTIIYRIVRLLAASFADAERPVPLSRYAPRAFAPFPIRCRIGERAPPLAA